jgi:hypothetical protein
MQIEMKDYPMKHRESFTGVICSSDDHTIVWELLNKYVPKEIQAKIIAEFNAHVDRFNAQQTS